MCDKKQKGEKTNDTIFLIYAQYNTKTITNFINSFQHPETFPANSVMKIQLIKNNTGYKGNSM